MIKVAIDGYNVNKPRGLGRYLQELLYALGRYPASDLQFEVFVPEKVDIPETLRAQNINWRTLKSTAFPIWEQFTLPQAVRASSFDLIHFPNNTATVLARASLPKRLVTVHDLTFLTEAGSGWYQKLGAIYRSHVVKSLMRQKVDVVTDSLASSEDITRHFGHASDIVHISVDYFYSNLRDSAAEETSVPVIPGSYFIHIGGITSFKNTARVIEAFTQANLPNYHLVVLGVPADAEFARKLRSERVHFPGWLSNAAVAALIQKARAMIFPSLREGYGMPIVESFVLGCAVVTSDFAPMSELAGDAALLIDPTDTTQLINAYQRLADDDALVTRLQNAGRERRSLFTARHMAEMMSDVYRKTASSLNG